MKHINKVLTSLILLVSGCTTPFTPTTKYPATSFLYNNVNLDQTSHVYLSNHLDEGKRGHIVSLLKNDDYSYAFIYLCNQGDYGGRSVSCFTGEILNSSINYDELDRWEELIKELYEDKNIMPIFWLFADDSSSISKAWKSRENNVKEFIKVMVDKFDKYTEYWVLGLEVDEWASLADANKYGSYLKSLTSKQVGIHQTTGRFNYMKGPWVDFGVIQCGFGSGGSASPSTVANYVRKAIAETGKPIWAGEYSKNGESDAAKNAGKAGLEAGAVGFGNGIWTGLIPY